MKIFISSVIGAMEEMRLAAKRAIEVLGHEALRAEDFTARAETPQQACLAGVRDADLVVLLLGARHGDLQATGLSATHEEYREAKDRRPVLVFVQRGDEPDKRQADFIAEVQSWSAGQFTKSFTTPEDLGSAVTRALHEFELARSAGSVDVGSMLAEAERLIPGESDVREATICIAVAGGPTQQVLRPAAIEDDALSDRLMQDAMFGATRIFQKGAETKTDVTGEQLMLRQASASLRLTQLGTVAVTLPAMADPREHAFSLIEEYVRASLGRAVLAAADVLDLIDGVSRLTDVVVIAAVVGGGYRGWITEADVQQNRGSWPTSSAGSRITVQLSPPTRKRAALRHDTTRIVDDLTVLLRRNFK